MSWQPPRRTVSSATTIRRNPSALRAASAAAASGAFTSFLQPSFWQRSAHPEAVNWPAESFVLANAGEDAANQVGHTMLDYGGKWCYDPTSRRAMFAACGANPAGALPRPPNVRTYSYLFNAFSVYDEASNTWTVNRGVKCPNEGADPDCIVHIIHNNTIDVTNRVFYKKKFRTAEIMRYNLATNAWMDTIPAPWATIEAYYSADGALEWIPSRNGSFPSGSLWLFTTDRNTDRPVLAEYNIQSGAWTRAVDQPSFGSAASASAKCMSYNPRAFGGAGGVLVGDANNGAFTVRLDTLIVAGAGSPPQTMGPSNGLKLCADPVGSGWYYSSTATGYLHYCNGTTWSQVAQLPSDLATPGNTWPCVLCPIHKEGSDYGVIWILAGQLPSQSGSSNGMGSWLFKP